MWGFFRKRLQDDANALLVAEIKRLTDIITTSKSADSVGREEFEKLERRVEQIAEDALSHLRRGTSALSRARKLNAEREEEEEPEEYPLDPSPSPGVSSSNQNLSIEQIEALGAENRSP